MGGLTCHSCGASEGIDGKPGRQDTCSQCQAYLRCCLNCRFYQPSAYNECSEPAADRVVDKAQGNFCDFFEVSIEASTSSSDAEQAKEQLATLFKKK